MRERLAGGMWGLLVGDALGVPYEFHSPEEIPREIEMEPPADFPRAHPGVAPGTWSDDGAHALCLAASLLHAGALDLGDLARRLTNWYEHGYLAVDGSVFDVGIQTTRALERFRAGASPEKSGPRGERDNGNGSLMRVLPLALWHRGDDAQLAADACRQSLPTHGHPRAQAACAVYCLWARRTLEGVDDPWSAAIAGARAIWTSGELRTELDQHLDTAEPGCGSGYVADTLRSARWAVAQGSYESAVRAAISLGHDTDTTACVAGGIAGLRDGVDAIPRRWLEALRGREEAAALIDELTRR